MKSRASFKHHPIHPMLVPFPIAFLTGALLFDGLGLLVGDPGFGVAAAYLILAGIAGGLVAAVPGVIDYVFTVPPESSAKRRATRHMLVNLTGIGVFGLAYLVRQPVEQGLGPGTAALLLEVAGAGLLAAGGWMGGTLAYANQIGVNNRYANAGRWSETEAADPTGEPIQVARAADLQVGQMRLVRVGSRRVVLGRTEEGYVAFDDHCTHKGGSLAAGVLICGTVQCPWHGSQFNVRTGTVAAGPAVRSIGTYDVDEANGVVRLHI
jgi:nitrite reductase/ring-hydroxylating ferredoxin subunit/uncharacterized membrane protein